MSVCTICGKPTSKVVDGRIFYIRCLCDYSRGYRERMRKTIHVEFREPLKTIQDWDPKLFRTGFAELMEIQKIFAIKRIRDFAFGKDYDKGAFDHNISSRNNLFVRGPARSGRGLLLATVKLHAAIREVSVTPLPCDYDIFRADFAEAESFGVVGEEKKAHVAEKYEYPQIMIVENVRAEQRIKSLKGEQTKRIRGSTGVDAMIARRMAKPGSILVSSYDFAGDIADSMGDRMYEVLESPKTSRLLLFDPDESVSLRKALYERKGIMLDRLEQIRGDNSTDRKLRMEKMTEDEQYALLEEALFFEEAFGGLPPMAGQDALPIHVQMEMGAPKWAKRDRALKVWTSFVESRKDQDAEFKQGIKRARIEAVRSCKALSPKMTEQEMLETGVLLSYACSVDASKEDEMLANWKRQAEESKEKMVSSKK